MLRRRVEEVIHVVRMLEQFLKGLKLGECTTPVYRKTKLELILRPICSRLGRQVNCLTRHTKYAAQGPLYPIF